MRTQIYLDEEEAELLGRAAARTGASRSELIRRAIRAQYGARNAETRLAGLHASAGVWRARADSGADYVERIRGGSDERWERLGLR